MTSLHARCKGCDTDRPFASFVADGVMTSRCAECRGEVIPRRRRGSIIKDAGFILKPYLVGTKGDPCVYCGRFPKHVTWDHIEPSCVGGRAHFMNLAPACKDCNRDKADNSLLGFLLGVDIPAQPALPMARGWLGDLTVAEEKKARTLIDDYLDANEAAHTP